jgi:cellulose synthase operon protein YhjQ
MTDRKALLDPNDTPEDVATLYSWANLHGAKYRDFSVSRAQTREKARQRVQDAIEAERGRSREEAEAQKETVAKAVADAAILAEAQRKQDEAASHQAAARQQALKAEQDAVRRDAAQGAHQSARQQAQQAARPVSPISNGGFQPSPADFPQLQAFAAPMGQPAYAPAASQAYPGQPLGPSQQPGQPLYGGPANQVQYASANPAAAAPVREDQLRGGEDHYLQVRNPWAPAETREPAARPAWISGADRADVAAQTVVPPAPEDTLQASRDRLTSRWFALNGLFTGASAPTEAVPAVAAQRAPVLAVFSLAGGVGKTSLVATLGRALSARGERVLLVDTAAFGLLPFFFGARDQRPGVLRTFTAPSTSGDAPIQMINVDPESLGPDSGPQETLTQEISRHSRGAGRIIVDLATASGAVTRRVLRMSPTVLVPVIPDMSSVVSVSSIDSFFQHNVSASGQPVRPYYVLNRFDPSLPLHLDVREVLREQLGDRLLPFALRRAPSVSEALAEGMTVMDYAPNSTAAEDYGSLAGWVKSLAAPASNGYRGVRWSER